MRISDWSSDVCSSDLTTRTRSGQTIPPVCLRPPSAQVQQMGRAATAIGASEAFQGNSKFSGRDENSNNITFGPALDQGRLQHPGLLGQMVDVPRSEEQTSELESIMRRSYAVF